MKVPEDLKNYNYMQSKNKSIFLTCFKQDAPSKIYTEVKENLLVIVLKGSKKLIYKDYITTIHEGEFAFFFKGKYIMNQIVNQNEYESLLIFVSDDFIRRLRRNTNAKETSEERLFYQGNMATHMYDEVELLLHLLEKSDPVYDEVLNLKIQELFTYILIEDKTGQFNSFLNTLKQDEDFKCFLTEHCEQYDTISSMAKAVNMSLSTFKRKFFRTFGVTPHKWMNDRKLDKAVQLIDNSDLSITDICFICGFESMTTFISLFKKKYGASPGRYRKAADAVSGATDCAWKL